MFLLIGSCHYPVAELVAQHAINKLFQTEKKVGNGGQWMTETVKIVNSRHATNPYSEVNNLTASENKNHVKPDTFGSIFPTPQ